MAPDQEPTDDPRIRVIAQAAKEPVEQRDRWLNTKGLSEAEKKKRTLTNLYNAHGWQLDLTDEEILEKLLELNLERRKADNHF